MKTASWAVSENEKLRKKLVSNVSLCGKISKAKNLTQANLSLFHFHIAEL